MNKQRKNDLKKIKESRERKIQKSSKKKLEDQQFHDGRRLFVEKLEKVGLHLVMTEDGHEHILDTNGEEVPALIVALMIGAIY